VLVFLAVATLITTFIVTISTTALIIIKIIPASALHLTLLPSVYDVIDSAKNYLEYSSTLACYAE